MAARDGPGAAALSPQAARGGKAGAGAARLRRLASQATAPSGRRRRGGRVAEGARLESVYTGNRIEGSNPSPSATTYLSEPAPDYRAVQPNSPALSGALRHAKSATHDRDDFTWNEQRSGVTDLVGRFRWYGGLSTAWQAASLQRSPARQ